MKAKVNVLAKPRPYSKTGTGEGLGTRLIECKNVLYMHVSVTCTLDFKPQRKLKGKGGRVKRVIN